MTVVQSEDVMLGVHWETNDWVRYIGLEKVSETGTFLSQLQEV